jgi:hypothetical protein
MRERKGKLGDKKARHLKDTDGPLSKPPQWQTDKDIAGSHDAGPRHPAKAG